MFFLVPVTCQACLDNHQWLRCLMSRSRDSHPGCHLAARLTSIGLWGGRQVKHFESQGPQDCAIASCARQTHPVTDWSLVQKGLTSRPDQSIIPHLLPPYLGSLMVLCIRPDYVWYCGGLPLQLASLSRRTHPLTTLPAVSLLPAD